MSDSIMRIAKSNIAATIRCEAEVGVKVVASFFFILTILANPAREREKIALGICYFLAIVDSMDPIVRFYLIIGGLLLLSVGLYFLSGFCYISKKKSALLYKKGKFVKTLDSGNHYFLPLVYRVSKSYRLGPVDYHFKLKNGDSVFFLAEIIDLPLYDSKQPDLKAIVHETVGVAIVGKAKIIMALTQGFF